MEVISSVTLSASRRKATAEVEGHGPVATGPGGA
jgi:hypothetical protein